MALASRDAQETGQSEKHLGRRATRPQGGKGVYLQRLRTKPNQKEEPAESISQSGVRPTPLQRHAESLFFPARLPDLQNLAAAKIAVNACLRSKHSCPAP